VNSDSDGNVARVHNVVQHGLTVQYGLTNTGQAELRAHLCQQLVEMADIMLDGYRTQLDSIKCHLRHQSKAYTSEALYEDVLRRYEQDRTLLLAPLSKYSSAGMCYSSCLLVSSDIINFLTPTVATWVQLLSILCQTGLSRHL